MRYILIFLIGLFCIQYSCSHRTKEEALALNDSIVNDQVSIVKTEEQLYNAIIALNFIEAETIYKNFLDSLQQIQTKYEKMKPFDQDDEFRKAIINLVLTYKMVVENEYKELITVVKKLSSFENTDELEFNNSHVKFKNLLDSIGAKIENSNNDFLQAQKVFADKYNLKLIDNN